MLFKEKNCESWNDLLNKRTCYLDLAIKNNDPTQCYNAYIGSSNGTNLCLSEYSIYKKDVEICRNLTGESTFPKNQCLFVLAYYTGDVNLCEELIGDDYNYNKYKCYTNIAKNKEDPSFCTQATYDNTSEYSSDDCYMNLAEYLLDESVCKNIKSEEYEFSCLVKVDELKKEFNECNNLREGSTDADFCWRMLATWTHNPKYCDKIHSKGHLKDSCKILTCLHV